MRKIYIYIGFITVLFALLFVNPVMAISLEEENKIGKDANEAILKQDKLYADEEAQKEMREMGDDLIKYVKRKEIKYTFQILDMQDKNAFAVPGGYIYYTSGLWKILTPEERAGVLAHEIIHVDQRHSLDALIKHQRRRLLTGIGLILIGANQTVQQVAGLVNTLHELKYSRGDERQADEMGMQLLVQADKNPAGLLLAMRKIMRMEDQAGGAPPKIFSSHPPTKERLDYMEKLLKDLQMEVPADNTKDIKDPSEVGSVLALKKDVVTFSSRKALQVGDMVWISAPGWDNRYENRRPIPIALGKVTTVDPNYKAAIKYLPDVNAPNTTANLTVNVPDVAQPEGVVGSMKDGKIQTTQNFGSGTRLAAWQVVWSGSKNEFINDVIGYIVLQGDDKLVMQRQAYEYMPVNESSFLTVPTSEIESRWAAAVASIGKRDVRVEAAPGDKIQNDVVYEILPPIWVRDRKIIAKAKAAQLGKKVTLSVYDFAEGWSIDKITPGFEIYFSAKND